MTNYFDLITRQRVSQDQVFKEYKLNKAMICEEMGVNNFFDYMKVARSKRGFLRVIN